MPERRIDPADNVAYSFDEISAFYQGKYKKKEIQSYWDTVCTSAKGAAKAKTKAKVKAKAKAKEKAAKGKTTRPANPKRFINEESRIVQDAIEGLVWSTPSLGRLDTFPDVKVVFRTDWKKDKVSLISGGGAGHEPMHGGFVGEGMLTAAVSGETFASPSIDAVLSAIVQVTGPAGCLLVIKNYTGDRLNFTLAAQRARALFGLKVETVITKDDVATVAERGIAGTLFVHKVAGAAAAAGKSLAEVKALAEAVIESTASMGVSFSSVRRLKPEMIPARKMELGLGIHGEPGSDVKPMAPVAEIVDDIMKNIMAGQRMQAAAPAGYACIVNNVGSVPPVEMAIVTGALMKSQWASSIKLLIGPAQLCTSLDMNGFSLSLLRLTPELAAYVRATTPVALWPAAVVPESPAPVAGMKGLDAFEGVAPSSDDAVLAILEKICKALVASKDQLDALDAKVGDADCGTTMAAAGTALLAEAARLPLADAHKTCACIAAVLGKVMGGSSGVLMSIMFMGMADELESNGLGWKEAGPKAFRAGLEAMMAAGGATTGKRTMLDALVPAADALLAGGGFAGARDAAAAGAVATKTMPPGAGRTENVPERVWRNVADPGAQAAALVFEALAK